MRNPLSKPLPLAVASIVKLLQDHPEDWKFCEHYAKHVGGAHVWIASGAWAADVSIPGIGQVLGRTKGLKATASHKAVYSAAMAAKATQVSEAVANYLSNTQAQRDRRERDAQERARRLEYAAGTFEHEAAVARQHAAALRAASALTSQASEGK